MPDRLEPEQHRIDAGAVTLNCLDYRAMLTGPPAASVLMLHGQADSAWSMHSIALSLGDRYRVFSLDLRGHGLSDRGGYSILQMVGDVRGAIDVLELIDPIVIGHSLGGQIAAQLCGIYPEIARALVMLEGLGPPVNRLRPTRGVELTDDQAQLNSDRRVVEMVRQPYRSRTFRDVDEAVERFGNGHPGLSPERTRYLVERSTRILADGSHEWLFDPAARDWLAGHDHGRAEQRWRAITCPVQVILGGEAWDQFWSDRASGGADYYSDEDHAAKLANFADVEEVIIPGAGHMLQYDQPDTLNRAIEGFLDHLAS
ncbi:MAG: alpha/beta hydrolase [Actinomycetia bacterium]|nr:alpha/beta hydrolase [Actinomycetes bacterium]MCP4963255.1 alpha/beta hydrolase [Actinomycetes bacterium]